MNKYALDAADERTLRQIGRVAGFGRKFFGSAGTGTGFLRGVGRMGLGLGKATASGAQWLGDTVVKHPTRSIVAGVPLAAGISSLGARWDRDQHNVVPENIYQY